LVEYRISEAREKDKCLLRIQCKPETSIPFWKHMGFHLYGEKDAHYAFRLLEKQLKLPEGGVSCQLQICFYPEERRWNDDIVSIKVFTPSAVRASDGFIYLSERVSFFDSRDGFDLDTILSIQVDGEQIYMDKPKYEKAKVLGVKNDAGAFYIEKLRQKK